MKKTFTVKFPEDISEEDRPLETDQPNMKKDAAFQCSKEEIEILNLWNCREES